MNKNAIKLMTMAVALFAGGMLANAAVIAHWSFDTDYTDSSASANNLTEVESGGATAGITTNSGEYVFGGGAVDFSSTIANEAYLTLGTAIDFVATNAWSASFWVRRAAGSDNRQGMLLGDTTDSSDFLWAANNPTQVQGMRFRNSARVTSDFGGHPDDGKWHHWAVVADGAGNVNTYFDKVAQTSVANATDFDINAVGHAYDSPIFSMNGQLDEMYIFNEAIDSATVSSLYTANVVPEPATLGLMGVGGLFGMLVRRVRRMRLR